MFAFLKRMFLLLVVNTLILVTLSVAFNVITSALGIQLPLNQEIYVWYGVMGFGSAFIALAMSRATAKWMLGVRVIDPRTLDSGERRLIETVHNLARVAQLPGMPEVGIYDSEEINAFATGPTKSRSLVAVSTGLLREMDGDAVTGVLGHEIAHIANGDMVTMTLLQGLVNTMVSIFARLIANAVSNGASENSRPVIRWVVFYTLQIALSLLGILVVSYVSRRREFRADAGGARLAGRERMLAGLRSLRNVYGQVDAAGQSVATLKISGRSTHNIAALFATHPPLEDRIRALESSAF